jgi:hypothetical protein
MYQAANDPAKARSSYIRLRLEQYTSQSPDVVIGVRPETPRPDPATKIRPRAICSIRLSMREQFPLTAR